MTKILVRQFSQLLLLVSPILTLNWSVLDWLGYAGGPNTPTNINLIVTELSGPKQTVELNIRIGMMIMGVCLVLLHDAFDYYLPQRQFDTFRSLYLEKTKEEWRVFLTDDIRVNILHARRRWFFPFVRIFYWTWNDGFQPSDSDTNLFITAWQGVAGRALRMRKPVLVDLREGANKKLKIYERWLPLNQFRLWPWQLSKTQDVKCILSVPMFISSGKLSPQWRSVGVINLDTLTDLGAVFLIENRETLSRDFTDYGKIIAYLS